MSRRRYPRTLKGRALVLAIALGIFLLRYLGVGLQPDERNHPTEPPLPHSRASLGGLEPGTYRVQRVVDGDTIVLFDGEKVRLQGIDTPETVKKDTPVQPWGPEATDYTRQFIEEADYEVEIAVEGEGRDQYDRYLAFITHDGRMLNEELVRQGLAKAKLGYDYPDQLKDRLRAAQDAARREGLGIWSR